VLSGEDLERFYQETAPADFFGVPIFPMGSIHLGDLRAKLSLDLCSAA